MVQMTFVVSLYVSGANQHTYSVNKPESFCREPKFIDKD